MKVGIVGSGYVGATAAYAMVMQRIGREIVLVDKNPARSEAEANDIQHAVPFAAPMSVRSGDYKDLAGARAVIVAAGVNQKPGETRLQLLERNAAVFRDVVPAVLEHAPDCVLVVATNPVDVMTHVATRLSLERGVPATRVVGSGTTLDTARFRTLLGRHAGVDSRHVHAYVIGEHGDSEVLTWSSATIAGVAFEEFCRTQGCPLTSDVRQDIDTRVRRAAYQIIEGKGATYYGVGSALARIVSVIIHDQRAVMTVCTRMENAAGVEDVTLSLPHILGGSGTLATIPLKLSEDERSRLQASAQVIREATDSLKLD